MEVTVMCAACAGYFRRLSTIIDQSNSPLDQCSAATDIQSVSCSHCGKQAKRRFFVDLCSKYDCCCPCP